MKFKLLGKKVALKVEEFNSEVTTEAGIILTHQVQDPEKPTLGEIVHIGLKCESKDIKVGDVVFFLEYQATTIDYEGTKYKLLDEDSLIAVV